MEVYIGVVNDWQRFMDGQRSHIMDGWATIGNDPAGCIYVGLWYGNEWEYRIERVGSDGRATMGNDLTGDDPVTHVCRVRSVSGRGEPGNASRGSVTQVMGKAEKSGDCRAVTGTAGVDAHGSGGMSDGIGVGR